MNKLYDSVEYNNLNCEYVSQSKGYVFMNIEILKNFFNATRDNKIGFNEAKNKQNDFLSKVTNIKIGGKTLEQENLERFYISRQEVINFFRDYTEMFLM